MKKTINILLFAVLLAGCTDLDIAPNSQLTDQSAFKKKSEFVNGLAGVYTSLWCWDEVVYKMGGSTDEMVFPARGADWKGDLQPLYLHTFTSSNGEISGIYSELSNIIAVSNTYIDMSPQMPSDWHYATLNELLVGNNKLSVHYAKTGKRISFKISSTESGWKIHFMLNDKAENILLNNSSIPSNKRKIELTGLKNTISLDLN